MRRHGWIGLKVLAPGDMDQRACRLGLKKLQADARNLVQAFEAAFCNVVITLHEPRPRQRADLPGA